jgi:hypothetical protein
LPFVCELRSRDAVEFQSASFLLLPLVLDALSPISQQCEPVVVRSSSPIWNF